MLINSLLQRSPDAVINWGGGGESSNTPPDEQPVTDPNADIAALDALMEEPTSEDFKFEVPEEKPAEKPSEEKKEDKPVDEFQPLNIDELLSDEKPAPKPSDQPPATRDLSAFDPQYHTLLRQMSGPAFDWVKEVHGKYKTTQQKFDELQQQAEAYQNSIMPTDANSYQMHPQYLQFSAEYGKLSQQKQHWLDQLAAIEEGKPFFDLVEDKNGNIQQSDQELQPSAQAKAQIQDRLMQLNAGINDIQNKASSFKESFAKNVTGHKELLANIDKKLFGATKMDQRYVDQVKAMFPEITRNSPEVQLIAKGWAVINGFVAALRKMKAAQSDMVQRQQVAKAVGPVGEDGTGKASSFDPNRYVKEMDQIINGAY